MCQKWNFSRYSFAHKTSGQLPWTISDRYLRWSRRSSLFSQSYPSWLGLITWSKTLTPNKSSSSRLSSYKERLSQKLKDFYRAPVKARGYFFVDHTLYISFWRSVKNKLFILFVFVSRLIDFYRWRVPPSPNIFEDFTLDRRAMVKNGHHKSFRAIT